MNVTRITPELVDVDACAAMVDSAAERWLEDRVRGKVTPEREQELDTALAEYMSARRRQDRMERRAAK